MAKAASKIDVLVFGGHPSAYLAAALLRHKSSLTVAHSTLPGEPSGDRLVAANPELFHLHPLVEPLRRKLSSNAAYGLRFLADDAPTASEYHTRGTASLIMELADLRSAMQKLARDAGVELLTPRQIDILNADETGMDVSLGRDRRRPTALIVAGPLSEAQHRLLGIPHQWEPGVMRRYTWMGFKPGRQLNLGARPNIPMSLDLKGKLWWGWLLPGEKSAQVAVEQPLDSISAVPPVELLRHWAGVLHRQGVLKNELSIEKKNVEGLDLPLTGALAHEGVAVRTLLIGPAGGFYSACGEDVYPNCWSAVFAAQIMKEALAARHLQDALQPFRQVWRTTLGDYLRGPHQNLRFLLPLVYRNQAMADRMAQAILVGKSVVR